MKNANGGPLPARPRPVNLGVGPSLARVSTGSRRLPNRALLYALEKWGKTSVAAHAPSPIFLLTRGEDGLETLIATGQLPEVPHFSDQARAWRDVVGAVDELVVAEHSYKTFVLDTLNGAQRLLMEQVCAEQFGSNWVTFGQWAQGMNACQGPWLDLLARLDRLREARGMSVLLLAHARVEKFTNPEGADFDRYQPEVDRKYLWPLTHKWLDLILFGAFETFTEEKKGARAKGQGGQARLIYTERHAAYDAGNRHGLPAEIDCGDDAKTAWANLAQALKGNPNGN